MVDKKSFIVVLSYASLKRDKWPFFRFVVGSAKEVIDVLSSRFTKDAGALYSLIHLPMIENAERIATLPDDDAPTFLAFCQFLKQGTYNISRASKNIKLRQLTFDNDVFHGLTHIYCRWCGQPSETDFVEDEYFPHCSIWCRSGGTDTNYEYADNCCAGCGNKLDAVGPYRPGMSTLCADCESRLKRKPRLVLELKEGLGLSKEFLGLQVGDRVATRWSMQTRGPLAQNTLRIDCIPSDDQLQHARIWVFADKWCVPKLGGLALFRLHKELCLLVPSEKNFARIYSLLDYVYTNTVGPKDATRLSFENSLRGLVFAYMADLLDRWSQVQEFERLLTEHAPLACDLRSAQAAWEIRKKNIRAQWAYYSHK